MEQTKITILEVAQTGLQHLEITMVAKECVSTVGRLLLGTTTEGQQNADNLTIADSGYCGLTIRSGTTSGGAIYFSDATSGGGEYDGTVSSITTTLDCMRLVLAVLRRGDAPGLIGQRYTCWNYHC